MNVDLFLSTLPMMAKGMAGIFIVTAVIILTMYILNALTKENNDK
jgi:Na+-transporting methylmalonyl-CoA/oxaloacetate decarboxylase gamma subunit